MDLLTDAIGLLGPELEEIKPPQRNWISRKRSESPSDFISKEDSIPFGPIFPLPQYGAGAEWLTTQSEFSLPSDFVTRFQWYQKRSELHYERQGKPLSSKTLTTKDERRLVKGGKERSSTGLGGIPVVGRGRSGGTSSKPPPYKHLRRNTFFGRSHVVLSPDEIQVCECGPSDGCPLDQCLNAVTHVECTPGTCPCGELCQNQRFQRCEYANVKPCKTEGRGWGLYAQEDIKAGQFIVEYCGEIINDQEAVKRSEDYRAEGLRDHYMLILSGSEVIDATKKGSYGRFINHSCDPSCVTKKWNVLGEVRVGVFAHRDIPRGEELTYDYDFEWYGGEKVRCQCGSAQCIGFLGAKSKRFKEDLVLWEDDDDRYEVDDVPTYDSDDEPIGGRQHYYSSDGEGSSGGSGQVVANLVKGDPQVQSEAQKVAGKRSPAGGPESASQEGEKSQTALPFKKRKQVEGEGKQALGVLISMKVESSSGNLASVTTTRTETKVSELVTVKKPESSGHGLARFGGEGRLAVADGQPHDRMQAGAAQRKRVKKESTGLAARLRLVKDHKKVVRGSGITAGRLVIGKASAKAQLEGGRTRRAKKGLAAKDLKAKVVRPIEWVPSEAARVEILARESVLSKAKAELEQLKEELRPKMQACIDGRGVVELAEAKRWVRSECTVARDAFERHCAILMHGLGLAGLGSLNC